jgi:hypothetical protein
LRPRSVLRRGRGNEGAQAVSSAWCEEREASVEAADGFHAKLFDWVN